MGNIAWLSETVGVARAELGGKAAGLGFLTDVGVEVPPGYVLTASAFDRAVSGELSSGFDRHIEDVPADASIEECEERAAAIRAGILDGTVAHPAIDDVAAAYECLCEQVAEPDVPVAVRSSAAGEDSSTHSFAGEHDSYLWVRGIEEVQERIRQCWASLFTARAISYRKRLDDQSRLAMAVVVQQMVDAQAAGVAMTLNPTNGDRSKVMIESAWGLGEPVVQGAMTPDRFLVDKVTREIVRREIADKRTELVRDPETLRGTVEQAVPEDRVAAASLSPDVIRSVVEAGRRIEQGAGCPQDIEFAVVPSAGEEADHRILVLQCRPETVWSEREPRSVGDRRSALDSVVSTLVAGRRK